jgi:methylenetetrahydrofolate dehydrogenase (NADP+)/methenyltetrahydrofolate cyclohydrolase
VRNKRRACETAGVLSISHDLPESTTQAELLALIGSLNNDPTVDGILVQAPLPDHIDDKAVVETIRTDKDVDGFHPCNIGRLAVREPMLRSCTPYGVMKLLEATGEPLRGKHAVVVGASNHVGRPMAWNCCWRAAPSPSAIPPPRICPAMWPRPTWWSPPSANRKW